MSQEQTARTGRQDDQDQEEQQRDRGRVPELAVVEGRLVETIAIVSPAASAPPSVPDPAPATPPSSISGASKIWMLPMIVMLTMKKVTR